MSFTFDFTPAKLARCINNTQIDSWWPTLEVSLAEYAITTVERVAMWLAQTGHESGDFRAVVENLNYGAQGLMNTWPSRFPSQEVANRYARQPEKIANLVYANRMGNGNEASGDGWKFRGRGLIQVTGKSNYTNCSQALYGDAKILLDNPSILQDHDGAVRSACWFWNSNNLNSMSDSRDLVAVTRRINGGTNGLDDRRRRYENNLRVLVG